MAERWKPVPGWEDFYAVSDLGRVRSLDRWTRTRGDGRRFAPGRILKAAIDGTGRYTVRLTRDNSGHTHKVHRLVLEAFRGPCPPGMECCHGPGGPLDNRLVNLRWGTKKQNAADKIRDGHPHGPRGEQCAKKLTEAAVSEIKRLYATGEWRQTDIAARFGVQQNMVSRIVCGQSWKHAIKPDDQIRSGGYTLGVAHHSAKLTEQAVREMRQRHAGGEGINALAREYGVGRSSATDAIRGVTWRHIA